MLQENPNPGIFVAMLHLVECIERQLVMRAVGVRGIDNSKKRGHHGLGLTADRPCLREFGPSASIIAEPVINGFRGKAAAVGAFRL